MTETARARPSARWRAFAQPCSAAACTWSTNATTPVFPEVARANGPVREGKTTETLPAPRVRRATRESMPRLGRRWRRAMGCAPDEIVFTSCGSESDNHAIASALEHFNEREKLRIHVVERVRRERAVKKRPASSVRRAVEHLCDSGVPDRRRETRRADVHRGSRGSRGHRRPRRDRRRRLANTCLVTLM